MLTEEQEAELQSDQKENVTAIATLTGDGVPFSWKVRRGTEKRVGLQSLSSYHWAPGTTVDNVGARVRVMTFSGADRWELATAWLSAMGLFTGCPRQPGGEEPFAPPDEVSTLRARVAELETSLDEAVNAEGGLYDKIENSLLTSLGFPGTIDEAIAEVKRLRDIVKEVEKVAGEDASPPEVRIALGEPPAPVDRIALRDAIADTLGSSAYDCTRVWSAWGYGTMDQDDFRPVVDDEDRLMEIVDAVVEAIAARQPCGVGVKA